MRTGYERVLAHRSSSSFSSAAKQNGTVVSIDKKLKMIRVEYDDKTIDVFSYDDKYTGSSGLVMEQKMTLAVEEGQKVKKGDILVYNERFFKPDPYSTQVDWKHGVMLNVAIAERNTTLQDANAITRRAGDRFSITPTEIVSVVIDSNSIVHDIMMEGNEVHRGDPLVTFEDGDLGEVLRINNPSDDTLEMIQELNRNIKKAPINGKVAKIDAYYGCPTSDMHPTLGSIIKTIEKKKLAMHKYSKDTDAEYDYPLVGPLPKGERYKNIDFNEHTVVLMFYITEDIGTGIGDKLVYDSSLKSVISDIIDEPIRTPSGVQVDAVFSGTGINRRTITSPLIVGTIQRVLEKTEKNIIDWWDKNKEVDNSSATELFDTNMKINIDDCPILTDSIIKPVFKQIITLFDKHDLDVSYMSYAFSEEPRNTLGKVTGNISKQEFGMCWTKNRLIYINPYFRNTIAFYKQTDHLKDLKDLTEFDQQVKHVLIHELCHEVYNHIASKDFILDILSKAEKSKFTTDYLNHLNKNHHSYKEEVFCEYLATSFMNN